MTIIERSAHRITGWDIALLAVLFLFLVTDVFSGALRFYLAKAGLELLIYAPKGLIAGALLIRIARLLYLGRMNALLLGTLAIFAIYITIGVFYTKSIVQPLFGAFVLLPILMGILTEPSLRKYGSRVSPLILVLWLCAGAGVLMDYFGNMLWAGASYNLGDIEITGSREWSESGFERVAGFSRTSVSAANQLLFLAILLIAFSRWKLFKFVVWIVTGALIAMTTTKTTIGAYALMTLIIPFMGTTQVPRAAKRIGAAVLPGFIAIIGAALPVSTLFIDFRLDLNSFVSQILLASFEDRLANVWPATFEFVRDHGNVLLGRGIGGIGGPVAYFEPGLESDARTDNMYLYLYATFGVLVIPLLWTYVSWISRLRTEGGQWDSAIWLLATGLLIMGWSAYGGGMGDIFTLSFLGITLAYAGYRRRIERAIASRARFKALSSRWPPYAAVGPVFIRSIPPPKATRL
jgi:hypothetical protein